MRPSPQTLLVLQALKDNARSWCHGYDLSKVTLLKSGTLYPLLSRLQDEGWLESRWEERRETGPPPRHLYRLSASGSRAAIRLLAAAAAKSSTLRPARQT